jgi:chemotaxis protein histidine kinase CheA
LEAQKKLSIEIDLSKDVVFPFIKMIQHDTNILEFVVKENGEDADLSKIGRIIVFYRRPDKEEIPRFLKANGNKINYGIGYQEMKLFGEGQIELQFYSLDNLSRVSTKRFKIYLSGSSGTDLVIESDKDLTLLQELFVEVSDLKTLAAQSTDIVDSEAERIENEAFRTANEDTRIANETSRVSAEALRNTAEAIRNIQEDTRERAEVIREENEDIRLENETIRQSAESTRSQNEATRKTNENERLTNESNRVSAESTRQFNESDRQSNEATRSNNEAQRISEENVRKSAETSRNNAEAVRNDNETIRQQQESDRQVTIQQAVNAAQNANVAANTALSAANDVTINSAYAKEQAEKAKEAAETAKTYWLNPVANFAAIATTYPNAVDGSQVNTIDTQMQYRKINGAWVWTGVNSANGLAELQAKFNDANMQIQTLTNGTSILTSALNSPVLIEVQGRTLTSL